MAVKPPVWCCHGLIVSFSVFALATSQIVALLHFSPTVLRLVAIAIIAILGLTLVIPKLNQRFELLFSHLPGLASNQKRSGWWSGVLTGTRLASPLADISLFNASTALHVTVPDCS
jgi:cytochrome c biogenesis protein CcdA